MNEQQGPFRGRLERPGNVILALVLVLDINTHHRVAVIRLFEIKRSFINKVQLCPVTFGKSLIRFLLCVQFGPEFGVGLQNLLRLFLKNIIREPLLLLENRIEKIPSEKRIVSFRLQCFHNIPLGWLVKRAVFAEN